MIAAMAYVRSDLLCICSMGEEEGAVEGLLLLWRRLNAELQRLEATPAARLLDEVLQAMDPASGLTLQDRQQVLHQPHRPHLAATAPPHFVSAAYQDMPD